MKTAAEFFDEGNFNNVTDMLIEFAKMHVLKIKHLQQSKYYSGVSFRFN